ncbi:MAG TPA: multicopper oxidase domain-containing protein [Actinomycetales bacterium]|nr:multicopper oxidase domain-containing protein [Actinomycetales bacterium]
MGLAAGGALAATPLFGRLTDGPDGADTVNLMAVASRSDDDAGPPPKFPRFSQPFRVPPVLRPSRVANGVRFYELEQRPALQQILPKQFPPTPIFGFNGIYPGPTITQTRGGDLTVVANKNSLPRGNPYSTHLHGSPNQPFYDGHPEDLVPVGATKTYHYPNNEEARTLWYHDHAIDITAQHVYAGLAAFFLHQPAAPEIREFGLDRLPSDRYDVPLVIADIQYTPDGRVFFDDHGEDSLLGNVVVVNGVPWPFMTVDRAKYRFRILQASVSRGYDLRLSNGMPMTVIATDSGFVRRPIPVGSFRMGTAERYEVVIDFSSLQPGTRVTLLNTAGEEQMRDVMQFVVGTTDGPHQALPGQLNEPVFPNPGAVVRERLFRFERSGGQWVINGLPWDERVVATPRANTTERWFFENKSGGWFHPVHVHLVDFQIVRRNGRAPFAYENGLKDTAYVGENERLELLMTFRPALPVDPNRPVLGKYVMHCHNLVHEDHAMMTEFDVRPGSAAAAQAGHARAAGRSMMVQWELRA